MDFLSEGNCEPEAIRAEFAHAGRTAGAAVEPSLTPADTVDERRGAVGARISECYGQVLPLRGLWTSTRGIGPRSKSEENRPTRRLVIEVTTQL